MWQNNGCLDANHQRVLVASHSSRCFAWVNLRLKGKQKMRTARSIFAVIAFVLFVTSLASIPTPAQRRQLVITKAVYGKEGQGRDVTRRLNNMIQNNTLDVKVTNDNMGGDPNKGADKRLKVKYTYRGQTQQKVVNEGDRLKLP
jgi:hypothetical protein